MTHSLAPAHPPDQPPTSAVRGGASLDDCPEILQGVDWSSYKIHVAGQIVGRLQQRENQYCETIIRLMVQVSEFQSFSHLARLEDGGVKVSKAEQSVASLREWIVPHSEQIERMRAAGARTKQWREKDLGRQAFNAKLDSIKQDFYALHSASEDPQGRGVLFERLLSDLFELFDLDPRRSFRLTGEQIDGAFTYDGTDYLVEAKWTKDLIEPKDLRDFGGKVSAKLDNTLGVFISMSGFTENAVTLRLGSRPNVILFAGADLNAVVEARIDLVQLLLRKRRRAAQNGEIFFPVDQILTE